MDLQTTLKELAAFTEELGAWQLKRHGAEDLAVDTKSSAVDFVTEMDKASEERIIAYIRSRYPDHGIYGEETGTSGGSGSGSGWLWTIDPIDGTTNYKHGYPIFSISIALSFEGETVLGLIHVPMLRQSYWAVKGGGAFLNGKPMAVSETQTLSAAVLSTGFPYDKGTNANNNAANLSALLPKISGVRRSGSAAFDLAQVAAGHTDGHWELRLGAYDIAAGAFLIQEAGGKVLVVEDGDSRNIIATNGRMQKELTDALRAVNPSNFPV